MTAPSGTLPPPRTPASRLAAAGLALGACLALALSASGVAAAGMATGLALYVAGLTLAIRAMGRHYPHDRLGGCNLVTTLRLALVGAVAAIGLTQGPGWPLAGLAALALALDGADGWLARREGLTSEFGAAYDMEVDAVLAACLALVASEAGRAGAELAVLGFARYAFAAAALALPWLGAPLPESMRRKAICVLQIGVLVALACPALPEAAARPLALTAALLLACSFARDIRRLAAAR